MKKTSFRTLAGLLVFLLLLSICGCAEQSQGEKARVTMVKIIDQLLDYEITIEQAKEKLESMYIPTDTAMGYAMTKYKDNILSSLKSEKLDGLKGTRDILADYDNYKDSDIYYTAFQDQFRNNKSFREYNAFMAEFNDLLSKLPEYTVTQLSDVELDFNSICHTYSIKNTVIDESFRLRIDTDKDNKITWAFLSGEQGTYTNIQFAVFAAYTYRSMGFEIVDYDAFYKKYDLFSKGEIYESSSIGDYKISSMTIDATNEITFSISAS